MNNDTTQSNNLNRKNALKLNMRSLISKYNNTTEDVKTIIANTLNIPIDKFRI